MRKKYFFVLIFILFLLSANFSSAQVRGQNPHADIELKIDGLTIYPNPVSNGKIYISTNENLTKEINIYDVLGKKIISEILIGKELNISNLTPGVYILKIKENDLSATRKLVVR